MSSTIRHDGREAEEEDEPRALALDRAIDGGHAADGDHVALHEAADEMSRGEKRTRSRRCGAEHRVEQPEPDPHSAPAGQRQQKCREQQDRGQA